MVTLPHLVLQPAFDWAVTAVTVQARNASFRCSALKPITMTLYAGLRKVEKLNGEPTLRLNPNHYKKVILEGAPSVCE